MFDGLFLSKIKEEFMPLITGRITKITSSLETEYILTIRANRSNYKLLISLSSSFSRIHLTKALESDTYKKNFLTILKKHIEGYFIKDIKTKSNDRIIYFILEGINEFEEKNTKYLYCEIMGRYSNLILADEKNTIIDSLHHDGIGEYNRTILPNAVYVFPESNKINPLDLSLDEIEKIFEEKNIDSPKRLIEIFEGISLFLASKAFLENSPAKSFYTFIHNDIKPSIIKYNQKEDFYFNPLGYEVVKTYESLSSMLDEYYLKQDLESKIKLRTNDLDNFINKQIKKYESKIKKLNIELIDTQEKDKYKLYGELLLSSPNLKEKKKNITILNYYDGKEISIPLDEKYSIIDNSNRYYKKYQKMKNSVSHIDEQLTISNNELEYFKLLSEQIKKANIDDALEIKQELINNKYLFEKDVKNNKKKEKPKFLKYLVDNTYIYVGKNNLQNEFLTHKFAKKEWYWFHVKDTSSSHVVVASEELTEKLIRVASILSAIHSNFSESSSIPVDYTKIKYIKKIPGKRNCFVTYSKHNTMYIDIDLEYLNNNSKLIK